MTAKPPPEAAPIRMPSSGSSTPILALHLRGHVASGDHQGEDRQRLHYFFKEAGSEEVLNEQLNKRSIGIRLSAGKVNVEELVHPDKVVVDLEKPEIVGTKPGGEQQDVPGLRLCRSSGR